MATNKYAGFAKTVQVFEKSEVKVYVYCNLHGLWKA